MNETQGIHKEVKIDSPEKKAPTLSRRDFLKLAGAGTAGLFLPEPNIQEEPLPFPINFRFANHALSPSDITPQTAIILGETHQWYLYGFEAEMERLRQYLADMTPKFDSPGDILPTSTSISDVAKREELAAVIKAREQGSQLVATDARHYSTLTYERSGALITNVLNKGDYLAMGIIMAVGGAALLPTIKNIVKKLHAQKQEQKKDVNPILTALISLTLLMSTVGIFGLSRDKLISLIEDLDLYRFMEEIGIEANVNAVKIFLGSFGDKMAEQIYKLSLGRNYTMALNLHLVQKTLQQNPFLRTEIENDNSAGGSEILFFAGGPHVGAESEYRRGADYLDLLLTNQIRKLIVFAVDRVSPTLKPAEPAGATAEQLQTALDEWILLTRTFSYPIPTYSLSQSFQEGPPLKIPYSPRAILWRELVSLAEKDPDNQALQMMGKRLLEEDTQFIWGADIPQALSALRKRAIEVCVPQGGYDDLLHLATLFKLPKDSRANAVIISEGIPYPALIT